MLKKIARRIKTYLVGDIMYELADLKSRLDSLQSLENLPELSKTLETAILSLALHADHIAPPNTPEAKAIPSHASPNISQSPSA